MDSAKDSGREMLAAINVEGSGFWLLFISQSVNINIPRGYLFSYETPSVGYLIYRYAHKYIYDE